MKSERAKQFIDECMTKSSLEISDHAKLRFCTIMTHLAELAEGETENRMRAKAITAYCLDCACCENGECIVEPDKCDARNEFIKAMNEE